MKTWKLAAWLLPLELLSHHTTQAQCPPGYPPGSTFYDTTIVTPAGINTMLVKFPQADPQAGMVTCMRLCITITGVVDFVSVENNSASPQTANVYYIRTDQITGPALGSPLSNSANQTYGPFNLAGSNGVLGSGPDYASIVNDTVLNAVTICRTINNPDSLFQFYGTDSVTYQYNITAFTNVTCTGGNYNSSVATSALVRFRFEYCTCPGYILPLWSSGFRVERAGPRTARLRWRDEENTEQSCYYIPELSRNGREFRPLGRVNPDAEHQPELSFDYDAGKESGIFYFRLRQVFSTGRVMYSPVREIRMENPVPEFFSLFPNPSGGIVGIKFADNTQGTYRVWVGTNAGQTVWQNTIAAAGQAVLSLGHLPRGLYWIKMTDTRSNRTAVRELIIK